jgi:flagellin
MLTLDNRMAQFGQRMLTQQAAITAQASQRLASGVRINSAKDDAAGLQIANRLTTQSMASQQLQRNLQDGISYSQAAAGALSQITDIAQKMRTLAVQAANSTNSEADRQALDAEYQQLAKNIDDIAAQTEVFGKKPLMGDATTTGSNLNQIKSIDQVLTKNTMSHYSSGLKTVGYIPSGSTNIDITLYSGAADDDLELFTTSGKHLTGTNLSDQVWGANGITNATTIQTNLLTAQNGFDNTASYDGSGLSTSGTSSYNGMNFTYSGDKQPIGNYYETLHIDQTTENLILTVPGLNGNGYGFNITINWGSIGNSPSSAQIGTDSGSMQITATNMLSTSNNFISIDKTPATTEAMGLSSTGLDPISKANAAINALDSAITTLGTYEGYHGAKMNAMEAAYNNAQVAQETTDAAKMRIEDADFAIETAKLSYTNILTQATNSVLAQANGSPSMALTLLKNSQ